MELLLNDFQQFLQENGLKMALFFALAIALMTVLAFALREAASWFCKTNSINSRVRDLNQEVQSLKQSVDSMKSLMEGVLMTDENLAPSEPATRLEPTGSINESGDSKFQIEEVKASVTKLSTDSDSFPLNH